MESIPCDPAVKETDQCLAYLRNGRCVQDIHHLAYPRRDYRKPLEAWWRAEDDNKIRVCRGLHDAIHASGHVPEKPGRAQMAIDLDRGSVLGAEEERATQVALGRLTLRPDAA